MRNSYFQKSFLIKKRGISTSNQKGIELPNINRTINTISQYNDSRVIQRPNLLDKFSWTLIPKDYDKLSDQQIYNEYKQLRKQLFNINEIVAKQLEKVQRKIQKKRIVTQTQPQKINQIRQKQIQNNFNILERMKKQYKGLQTKSSTLQPKQTLETRIQQTKHEISLMRKKINSLKLKNKSIGKNIMSTDEIIAEMHQTEKQYQMWMRKRQDYLKKLEKIQYQQEEIAKNLGKIDSVSKKANSFIRSQIQNKHSIQQQKKLQQNYKVKSTVYQINKKNHDTFQNLRQQKYHQLLKQLQRHVQKDNQFNIKMEDTQYKIIQFSEEIKNLQNILKKIRSQVSQSRINKTFFPENQTQKTVNSQRQKSSSIKRNAPKFNTYGSSRFHKKQLTKKPQVTQFQTKQNLQAQQKKSFNIPKPSGRKNDHSNFNYEIQNSNKIQIGITTSKKDKQELSNTQNSYALNKKKRTVKIEKVNTETQITEELNIPTYSTNNPQKNNENDIKSQIKNTQTSLPPSNPNPNKKHQIPSIIQKSPQQPLNNIEKKSNIEKVQNSQREQETNKNIVLDQQEVNEQVQEKFSIQKLSIDLNKIQKNIEKVEKNRERAKIEFQ